MTGARYLANSAPATDAVPSACEAVGTRNCLTADQGLRGAVRMLH